MPGQQPVDSPQTASYQTPGYPPNPAYTPYQSYGYPYPMMPGPQPEPPKGFAITGMVLGIVGLCTSLFYIGGVIGIVGLIFSIIALRAARRGQSGGKGMAIAGLVTSIVAIVVNAIEIVLIVWVFNTATNCAQYDPQGNPQTGSQSQFDQCMQQGIFGN
jgi:hypothetical protein